MTERIRDATPETPLEELFKVLGNEVRIEILWTLSQAAEPLPFTTLQEAIGVEDSGNFNYHVDKLTDHFITRTDRGYELSAPGRAVVRTIRVGAITRNPELSPRRIDLSCPFCGADQEFQYEDETVHLSCSSCVGVVGEPYNSGTIMTYEFPVAGLRGRTEREVAAAAHHLYDAEITAMLGGVCPHCAGRVEHDLDSCVDHEAADSQLCGTCGARYGSWVEVSCTHCMHTRRFPTWFTSFHQPEVIAYFHEAAGFTRELPFPKFLTMDGTEFTITEERRSTEPLEIAITLERGGARCTVLVDEDLGVTVEETVWNHGGPDTSNIS